MTLPSEDTLRCYAQLRSSIENFAGCDAAILKLIKRISEIPDKRIKTTKVTTFAEVRKLIFKASSYSL